MMLEVKRPLICLPTPLNISLAPLGKQESPQDKRRCRHNKSTSRKESIYLRMFFLSGFHTYPRIKAQGRNTSMCTGRTIAFSQGHTLKPASTQATHPKSTPMTSPSTKPSLWLHFLCSLTPKTNLFASGNKWISFSHSMSGIHFEQGFVLAQPSLQNPKVILLTMVRNIHT